MSPAALLVAILALVISAAGAGYAAGQIGTKSIKNNAITAKKIKKNAVTGPKIKAGAVDGSKIADRSVGNADLVPEGGFQRIKGRTSPEGDCKWTEVSESVAGVLPGGFRKTRSGEVLINAFLGFNNLDDGDEDCGGEDEVEDFTIFTLPPGYRPPAPILRTVLDSYSLFIGGTSTAVVMGRTIPAGAVIWIDETGTADGGAMLDLSFTAAGAAGAPASAPARPTTPQAPELARQLFGQG